MISIIAAAIFAFAEAVPQAGTASYYSYPGATTSCGTVMTDSSKWVALSHTIMKSSLCGSLVTVTYNGKTVTYPVQDNCMGCDASKIDLSQSAFSELQPDLGVGIIQIDWSMGGAGAGGSGPVSNPSSPAPAQNQPAPAPSFAPAPATPSVVPQSQIPVHSPLPSSTPITPASVQPQSNNNGNTGHFTQDNSNPAPFVAPSGDMYRSSGIFTIPRNFMTLYILPLTVSIFV